MLYGLDIGGTKIELAVFNEKLEKQYSERVPTPQSSYEEWLRAIETLVYNADKKFGTKGTVGLGIPGFVNHKTGLAEIANIAVAHDNPILKDLSERLEREVRAENDANCLALSEAWDESNLQYSTVLGLIIGTGFGGGIVMNGKAHSGQIGMAGEVGHIQLNYHALKLLGWDKAPIYKCGCGNTACLDSYISGRGFEMLYNDLVGQKLNAKKIIERFYAKDPKTTEFVEKYIELMAICISPLVTVLAPDMIVFGGGLSNFDYIYDVLPKTLSKYLMRNAEVPVIKKAVHGDSSGIRGAAALFLER
ncbi:MAG: N-acetylglucosamine kinase [[Actinobacillus] rossii]|uniref:N-acetylglucosamine kinase n=1 Tax=[Actinobacillus] rossii TaxID=123820 RepID=A0A380TUX4_9PAST|nr:N-acetylglucosamine kinase [[Actinobacillus] rossii]MDY4506760.1 N-acetylglucosamine kinase [[Actinobacillus] rossii]SUT92190.1 N-acetyl-D-glucosamine kinase [[Actinobacillus] rossii]